MVLSLLIDIAKKIADKCVGPIVGYIGTEVGHVWNYSANLKNLEEEVVNMNAEITFMNDRIEDAGYRLQKTKVNAVANNWVEKMARLIGKGSKIIEEEERETGRCLMGLRPNLLACYRASKSAKKVMDDAEALKKAAESITTVAHVDYSQCLGFAINPDFEELESRKSAAEQIVAYLKDPNVKMVGMHGMGGTGKTTLAEKIGVQLYEGGTFRYVVKADVSNNENKDLVHIQKQIADQLKISLGDDKDDVKARATRLREQLGKNDKVLIILDDIWSKFDLTKVGIPLDGKLKILITSRDEKVMNEMGSRHNVPLNVLSPEDSWKLFDRMAYGVAPDSDRYSTAREVVEQCGGIPVLLVTIAIPLRDEEDLEIWKEALFQLKKFEGDNFVEDGYKRLEVSYNFLRHYELKSLFLLCAQLDHRFISIDDLLRYSMGLDLYNREKLCEVRSKLHMHLRHLKGCCLLQDGDREGTVRMHDVVHKFAASIANKDRGISRIVAEAQLQEWPSKDKVGQFSISLPHRHLPNPDHQLPVAFDSSKLESFLLLRSEYEAFLNVPDEFFIGMKELKLVDVRRMCLSPALCSSLNVLRKLRTLCLDYCKLDDIAVIGDLPMLQVLSLKGSTVSQIRRLGSNLKLLDLSDCGQLKVIASGVFCNLTLLEDLRIIGSFDKWEPLQGCNSGSDHETSTTEKLASLREFKNLGNLINLDIQISDPKTFPKDLVFKKVERFKVFIGIAVPYYSWFEIDSETLKVKDIQLYEGIKVLMRKAKKLHLEGIQGVTSVSELLFPNLTSIKVTSCNVMKYLFSSHLALRGLSCLKEISVKECWSMESIVSRESENRITGADQLDDEEEEIIKFPQLRKLELTWLISFISFYSSSTPNPIISSSQDPMSSNQWLSTSLFDKKVVLPKLEELRLEWLEVDQIWDDQFAIETERINCCFQNLTFLKVSDCPNLSYLFTSSMVRSLVRLKELEVWLCKSILEIVATTGEMVGDEEEIIEFTQLQNLDLSGLDRLISFYSSSTPNPIIFSSQERQEQDRLPTSFLNKKVVLPKLEELRLRCLKVDQIWDDQFAIDAQRINCCFQNLTILKVSDCPNLSYLFTSSMVRSLAQLKELRVWYCKSILEIVATKGEMVGDEEEIIEFTQLRELRLADLGRLISFYSSNTPNPIISSSQERQEQEQMSSNQRLKKLQVEDCESIKEIVATKGEMTFSFPALGFLKLKHLPRLKRFCHANLLECHSLAKLEVGICPELNAFITNGSSPAGLDANSSSTLFHENVAFPNLEEVEISGINKVKMIWENQLHLNLRKVTVSHCPSLTSIFPASVALVLKQLESLSIIGCENLKEIVSNEEEEDSGPTFVFPKLTSLEVDCCDKLIDPSNLNIQKIITAPSLEVCNLQGTNVGVRYEGLSGKLKVDGDTKKIGCSSVFPIAFFEIFQELKKLHIARFCFEQLFPCEPDVGDDHDIDTQAIAKTLARTKHLYLSDLSEMKHIWSEQYANDQFDGILLNLQILKVKCCGSLISLAPKSALFQNLTRLVVMGCNELIKLVASSTTAKSLVNLTEMRVSECDSLKEIVAIYDDHDGEEASNNTTEDIVFGKLATLVLHSLRSLTSFTANNCNFQFPSLERVVVAECPNMEFFSKGALSTPKLSKVWVDINDYDEEEGKSMSESDDYDEEEGKSMSESDDYDEEEGRSMWESDLNSTVRQLYKAMNSTDEYLEPK